jgi:glutathione S-transferase
MVDTPLTIGYWKIRGLQAPIRYVLEYLSVPYTEVLYEQGEAPEFSREAWLSEKQNLGLDFPNLPYLIEGDVKITESHAILRYISNKYGAADFSGKDIRDKAYLDMIFAIVSDIKNATTGHFYMSGNMEAVKKIGLEGLEKVEKFLGEKKLFLGDYVTFVDFFIFEQVEMFAWATEGEILTKYPNLAGFHKRIIDLPKFGEYYASERFMRSPFNNKIAKLNN